MFHVHALAFSLAPPAHATQTQPVTDLEGAWDLACTDAEITVQIGIVATSAGIPYALDGDLVIDVACGPDGADPSHVAAPVYDACRDAGIPHGVCRDLARDVREAVRDASDAASPVRLSIDVDENDVFGQWFGYYPSTAVVSFADGRDDPWGVSVDNNDGPTRGSFVALNLGLDGDATGNLGCLALGGAIASGRVDPADTASLVVGGTVTLICAADLGGGDAIAGDVAIAVTVAAEG